MHKVINSQTIANSSDAWVKDLKQAIVNVDSVTIDSLLEKIKDNNPDLARAIYHLIENFEYEITLAYLHGLTDASTNHMFLWNMELEF